MLVHLYYLDVQWNEKNNNVVIDLLARAYHFATAREVSQVYGMRKERKIAKQNNKIHKK